MPVCIAGMHRSGTSMIAHLLYECGLYLGPESDLLPPGPGNEEGFWENRRFLDLNERILADLGAGWNLPPSDMKGWESRPSLQVVRDDAASLLAEFAGREPWGWKDPRNSLTLPFWQELLPDLRVVICVRHPMEVASSLTVRDGVSQAFGFRLWRHYYEVLLRLTAPEKRVVTHYGAYFPDAEAELERLATYLGMRVSPEATRTASTVASRRLRHHEVSDAALEHAEIDASILSLYRDLCSEAGPVFAAACRATANRAGANARRKPVASPPSKGRVNGNDGTGAIRQSDVLPAMPNRALMDLYDWSTVARTQIDLIHRRLAAQDARSAKTEDLDRWSAVAKTQIHNLHVRLAADDRRFVQTNDHLDNLTREQNARLAGLERSLQAMQVLIEERLSDQVARLDRIDRLVRESVAEQEAALRVSHSTLERQIETLDAQSKAIDVRTGHIATRVDRLAGDLQAQTASLGELQAMRADLAGPRELVRVLIDVQRRLGVPFTISGACHKIRRFDQWLKRLGRRGAAQTAIPSMPSVAPSASSLREDSTDRAAEAQVIAHCDHPPLESVARIGSELRIKGWAVPVSEVSRVEILIDNLSLGYASYARPRPDVGQSLPGHPDAGHSGFAGRFDLTELPPGRHDVCIRLHRPSGGWSDLSGAVELDHSYVQDSIEVPDFDVQYEEWLRQNKLTEDRLIGLKGAAQRLGYRPTVSILMPVFNTPPAFLRAAIDSVRDQVYDSWQLCIVDDASTDGAVREVLEHYAAGDARIRVRSLETNLGIAGATNAALALAEGEFVGLLDHDDELWPNALYECVKLLNRHPDADLIYSDEDKITPDGHHYDVFFKPDWSPDLLTSMMYLGHFAVYRRELVERVGGFRTDLSGSQDYDLALRVTELTERVHHLPTVLYSWRSIPGSVAANGEAKPFALVAARQAIEDSIGRRGIGATVEPGVSPGRWRVRYRVDTGARVSLVIPTGGNLKRLEPMLRSLFERTGYDIFEVVVIDNSVGDGVRQAIERLGQTDRCRYLEFRQKPFNFSAIVNFGVSRVDSHVPYLVLMNDDLTVLDPGWLEAMLEHAQRPEVGVVGAKLLYPNRAVQHAGVVLGIGGVAGHAFKRYPPGHSGPIDLIDVVREVSAVTFACAMMRRDVFEEVGGLDAEHLPVSFNDVDFCLRVRQRGYRVVYTPYAVLHHHESASRWELPSSAPGEVEFMKESWDGVLRADPYYNRNLTRTREDFSLGVVDDPGWTA